MVTVPAVTPAAGVEEACNVDSSIVFRPPHQKINTLVLPFEEQHRREVSPGPT